MKKAAYSRDIRPEFVCVMSSECIQRVREFQYYFNLLPMIIKTFCFCFFFCELGERK